MIEETKTERFERLAEKRMVKLLTDFRLVGNLCSAQYNYTQDHIDKIMDTVDKARQELEYRFAEPSAQSKPTFVFNEPELEPPERSKPLIDEGEEGYETEVHTDRTG